MTYGEENSGGKSKFSTTGKGNTILSLDLLKHLYLKSQDLISEKVRSQNKEIGKLCFPSKIMLTNWYLKNVCSPLHEFVTELLMLYVTRKISIQSWASWQCLTFWWKIPKSLRFSWHFALLPKFPDNPDSVDTMQIDKCTEDLHL